MCGRGTLRRRPRRPRRLCTRAPLSPSPPSQVEVRKALHVDVPQKNGEDWMICGIGQKGQQGGYRPDFGSLLPHYKDTLIPAIRVRRPSLGGPGPEPLLGAQRSSAPRTGRGFPGAQGLRGGGHSPGADLQRRRGLLRALQGQRMVDRPGRAGRGRRPLFPFVAAICPCAFVSQLCLSFGIIYTQRTGPGDDPAAPGPRSAATSSSPGARGRSTRRSRAT